MSYPKLPDNEGDLQSFSDDLLHRKEFYQFASDPTRNFRDPNDYDALRGKFLRIRSHQLFTRNLFNPNTPYKRLLLKWKTGAGKTIGFLAIATEFIKLYQKIYRQKILQMGANRRNYLIADKETPSVFVIGFTKLNIIKELLKYPEFGFITISERDELNRLQKIAEKGDPSDIKNHKDYLSRIRRRITNKTRNGFYKFFGYQEFVNRLFISDDINLTELESIAMKRMNILRSKGDTVSSEESTLETVIREYIESGKIQINLSLMKQFENSLIICDEIHNTYNSFMKNNYGVAIQYVLDSVVDVRAVFLSATPLNNSPTEIVDVLNYLLPPDKKITRKDLFGKNKEITSEALEKIGLLSYGRVSFIQDVNPLYYPEVKNAGVERRLRHEVLGRIAIPYLKFIKCDMSKIHLNTYKQFLEDSGQIGAGVNRETIVLPTDSYTLIDMVFPNPKSDTVGLYKSSEVRSELLNSKTEWRNKVGVRVSGVASGKNYVELSGEWLKQEKIGKYNAKLEAVGKSIENSFKNSLARLNSMKDGDEPHTSGEKIIIYHERVRMSGVLLIAEYMRENNIIDEYSEPVDMTKCAICSGSMLNHDKFIAKNSLPPHMYYPARFVMAHSEVNKATMLASLDKYNSQDNAYGTNYKFLIGSKIIRESYDIKDTAEMHIMSLPIHISGLNQLRGRVDRHGSHLGLPKNRRTVTMYYYLTTIPDNADPSIDSVSVEEYKYVEKLVDYMEIQKIEQKQHEYALDGVIHRDIIMPDALEKTYFDKTLANAVNFSVNVNSNVNSNANSNANSNDPIATIAPLYFKNKLHLQELDVTKLNLSTFNAREYGQEEIKTIGYIIKRLFLDRPVWTYSDLWEAVKSPPFGIEVNPKLFEETSFAIALNNLVESEVSYIDREFEENMTERPEIVEKMLVSMMFDTSERYIYKNMVKHKIEQIGDYYILFQVLSSTDNKSEGILSSKGARTDKTVYTDVVVRDIESFMRPIRPVENIRINIDRWLKDSKADYNYDIMKQKFKTEYGNQRDTLINIIGNYSPDFYRRLLSDIIVWYIDEEPVIDSIWEDLYKGIIDIFDQFGSIIYISDVLKYKETAKKFLNGDVIVMNKSSGREKPSSEFPRSTPVGFTDSDGIHLYDSPDWIIVSKISMNLRTQFTENSMIVGYFETGVDGVTKFKLRRPVQKIKKRVQGIAGDKTMDTRIIERGIVCGTKNKPELVKIAEMLKINIAKLVPKDDISLTNAKRIVKIKTLCDAIKTRLIELEVRERLKDTGVKYLYLWYEEQPVIA